MSTPRVARKPSSRTLGNIQTNLTGVTAVLAQTRFEDVEHQARASAHNEALELIKTMRAHWTDNTRPLQVATAESLTAGLIFSTLVDVPFGGNHKYGAFSVYDTDAKRVLLGVTEPDVYTHNCASQMALGVLANSNASLALAVTGNAMPEQRDYDKQLSQLGEVFIGVAGYVPDPQTGETKILVQTKCYNFCAPGYPGATMARLWLDVVKQESTLRSTLETHGVSDAPFKRLTDGYNEFLLTSHIASYNRNMTTAQGCKDLTEFIKEHYPVVPDFINKVEHKDPHQTKFNIGNMYDKTGGINNTLLQDRPQVAVEMLNPNADTDRTHKENTRELRL